MRRDALLTLSTVLLCCACGAPRQHAAPRPPAGLDVRLEVVANMDGRESTLRPGAALRSGDRLRFRLRASRPAYVYLLHEDTRGSVHILYPSSDLSVQSRAGTDEVAVPRVGWFRLDESEGREAVYVIASERPLYDLAAIVRRRAGALAGAEAPPDEEGAARAEPPPAPPAAVPPTPGAKPARGESGSAGPTGGTAPADAGAASRVVGAGAAPERTATAKPRDSLAGTHLAAADRPRARRVVRRGMVYEAAAPEPAAVRLGADAPDGVVIYRFAIRHLPPGGSDRARSGPR